MTSVSRYFTDQRLLANLVCATWPAARHLAISPAFADRLDTHVAERQALIAYMVEHKGKIARHAIYDRPPDNAAQSAALITIVDRILAGHDELLGELTDGPDGRRWAEHFIRAETHCSPGLVVAAAPHVARYRKRPPNGSVPAAPRSRRSRSTSPSTRTVRPPTVQPLPLQAAAHRFGAEHIPAFLPDDWHARHFAQLRGVHERHLRRAVAIALVQLAAPRRVSDAAVFLGIPEDSGRWSYNEVADWAHHSHDGTTFLGAVHALAAHLDTAADRGELVDYRRRRTHLAGWLIPQPDWQQIADRLRRNDRGDYGERKRNTASALVWIKATQGEHLFAPHRQSPPGYRPGSVDDRGLSIDRAWWRTRNNQPHRHYPHLDRICTQLAERIADRIDSPDRISI